MELLIPATYNWIKEKGRAEGLKEGEVTGRKEERQAHRRRLKEAYQKFGIEVDGKITLTITPEVKAFLNGETENQ